MPLPFPLSILPHYLEAVQLGLPPTILAVLKQPSLLLHPTKISQIFFSHVWAVLGPGIDSNSQSYKQALLHPHALGVVLDIGAGHGHTMQYLDRQKVKTYVAVEPNAYMHKHIWAMAERCGFSREKGEVVVLGCRAENIEMIKEAVGGDGRVDTIVSILTLCSVKDPKSVTKRLVGEVLREGGEVLWCEHVRSPLANVSFWQNIISPVWGLAFDGCRMCQDTIGILLSAGKWTKTEIWDMPGEEKKDKLMFHQIGRFIKA